MNNNGPERPSPEELAASPYTVNSGIQIIRRGVRPDLADGQIEDTRTQVEMAMAMFTVGDVFRLEPGGLDAFENFFESIIKPAIARKHNMQFHGSNVSIGRQIEKGLTKHGIKTIDNITIAVTDPPSHEGEDLVDCCAFMVNCTMAPCRRHADSGAIGEKAFLLILKIGQRRIGGPARPGKKILLTEKYCVQPNILQSSAGVREVAMATAARVRASSLKTPFQGGAPGLGGGKIKRWRRKV